MFFQTGNSIPQEVGICQSEKCRAGPPVGQRKKNTCVVAPFCRKPEKKRQKNARFWRVALSLEGRWGIIGTVHSRTGQHTWTDGRSARDETGTGNLPGRWKHRHGKRPGQGLDRDGRGPGQVTKAYPDGGGDDQERRSAWAGKNRHRREPVPGKTSAGGSR